jgi:hypothetical protein
VDILDAADRVRDVLGPALVRAIGDRSGEIDHAFFDHDVHVAGIEVVVIGEVLVQVFADALVGALVVARADASEAFLLAISLGLPDTRAKSPVAKALAVARLAAKALVVARLAAEALAVALLVTEALIAKVLIARALVAEALAAVPLAPGALTTVALTESLVAVSLAAVALTESLVTRAPAEAALVLPVPLTEALAPGAKALAARPLTAALALIAHVPPVAGPVVDASSYPAPVTPSETLVAVGRTGASPVARPIVLTSDPATVALAEGALAPIAESLVARPLSAEALAPEAHAAA